MVEIKKKIVHEKAPSTKEVLLTTLWESWNQFEFAYCCLFIFDIQEIKELFLKITEFFCEIKSLFSVLKKTKQVSTLLI